MGVFIFEALLCQTQAYWIAAFRLSILSWSSGFFFQWLAPFFLILSFSQHVNEEKKDLFFQDPGSGIFLQKSDSIEELWHVIAHKIPKAIELNSNIRLVIIDSIAALFRAEQGMLNLVKSLSLFPWIAALVFDRLYVRSFSD